MLDLGSLILDTGPRKQPILLALFEVEDALDPEKHFCERRYQTQCSR
jgi:hypothetical protein